MLERFNTLPQVGETIALDGLQFEVLKALERRIATVLVTRLPMD